jgi:hypothetical protein
MGCFAYARIVKEINKKYKTIIICFLDDKKIVEHFARIVASIENTLCLLCLTTFEKSCFSPTTVDVYRSTVYCIHVKNPSITHYRIAFYLVYL